MPSTREVQQHFGFASQTAVLNHFKALERKGVLMRRHRKARAVSIVADRDREPMIQIPIYGAIAAGMPEAQEEETIGTVAIGTLTSGLSADTPTFAL
jgi:repressor LexA